MAEHLGWHLILGLIASILLAVGLLLMKSRGAVLPAAAGPNFLRSIGRWLCDPIWMTGIAIQTVGYAIYLIALSSAPVSMLAVMMQGGIAVFVVFAAIFLHERASLREWTGIVGVLVAMLLLVISINGQDSSTHSSLSAVRLLSAMAIIAASLPFLNARLRKQGLAAAFASGIAFGLGSLYAKIITLLIVEAKAALAFSFTS